MPLFPPEILLDTGQDHVAEVTSLLFGKPAVHSTLLGIGLGFLLQYTLKAGPRVALECTPSRHMKPQPHLKEAQRPPNPLQSEG